MRWTLDKSCSERAANDAARRVRQDSRRGRSEVGGYRVLFVRPSCRRTRSNARLKILLCSTYYIIKVIKNIIPLIWQYVCVHVVRANGARRMRGNSHVDIILLSKYKYL